MHREYHKWYSPSLNRDMELLIFGHGGTPVLFFPTRCARFYDYENWSVLEGAKAKIEQGHYRFICLDSIDVESFYCYWCRPESKIQRHLLYEKYILEEVIPLVKKESSDLFISAGCSMGAFHAVNLAFKYPSLFSKVLGMSGRYDLCYEVGNFKNLFEGYWDESIYFNMPSQYLANLSDSKWISQLQHMEIILAMGKEDLFMENNLLLSSLLAERQINHSLYLWEGEAHKPWYWRQMLSIYF
ncbi:esterase family protein [Desertivirga arenae]|uniref:esterase family protein n=1 Tax=Desertivirga arenae TaxID=2810309 RepID=UPI001F604B29|nr:alpha/beta hydrolase-fold protein [Pedobacter sp. SYSU D00823]